MLEIWYLLLSFVILGAAWATKKFVDRKGYKGAAFMGAAGVVLILRPLVYSIVNAVKSGNGDFLVRPFGGGWTALYWLLLVIGLVSYAVWYVMVDNGPAFLRNSWVRPVFLAYGGSLFLLTLITPTTPLWWVIILVMFVVFGLRQIATGAKLLGLATLALVAIAVLSNSVVFTSAFWQQGVGRDLGEQIARIPAFAPQGCDSHDPACKTGNDQPKGELKPQVISFTAVLDGKVTDITVTCASEKVCADAGRQAKVVAHSAANALKKPAKVTMKVGNKTVGSPFVVNPDRKTDQQYGAVSHDNCITTQGKPGVELPDPGKNTLTCRPKAGHTGPNF